MKTQICITIDVEFDIAGTFADPEHRRPAGLESVRCLIDGEDEGLGYILRTLETYGLSGVFFVEALNTCYFGDGPMGEVTTQISSQGHDLELHLHPVWAYFLDADWHTRLRTHPPNDSMARRNPAEIRALVQRGLATFERWQLPAPIALRAGSLAVNRSIYPVIKDLGIPLASNLGMGLYRPTDPELHLNGGRHFIEGVLEIPVTSYRDVRIGGFTHWKLMTVVGVSTAEMESVIGGAAAAGMNPVVILTHPSEYVRRADSRLQGRVERNTLSRKRLASLCRFLVENADRFEVTTFRDQQAHWLSTSGTASPVLTVPPWLVARRFVENRLFGRLSRR